MCLRGVMERGGGDRCVQNDDGFQRLNSKRQGLKMGLHCRKCYII